MNITSVHDEYISTTEFFDLWTAPPTKNHIERLLDRSDIKYFAISHNKELLGFITVLTDFSLFAYISLLEVRKDCRNQGIGTALLKRALDDLMGVYAIDLTCDENVIPYYRKFGFKKSISMSIRDYSYHHKTMAT